MCSVGSSMTNSIAGSMSVTAAGSGSGGASSLGGNTSPGVTPIQRGRPRGTLTTGTSPPSSGNINFNPGSFRFP